MKEKGLSISELMARNAELEKALAKISLEVAFYHKVVEFGSIEAKFDIMEEFGKKAIEAVVNERKNKNAKK